MIPFLKKKIYLTRTEEDNLNFQKRFNLLHPKLNTKEVFVSVPLLKIFFENINNLYIPEENLIFTSRYGIKALSKSEDLKLKKIFCVGKSTAETAVRLGFQDVLFSNEGNVYSLIKLISSKEQNKKITFHYMRGKKISFNLKKELSELGFKIKETIIYKQESNLLSYEQKALVRDGQIGGIIFFSATVAKSFCEEIKKVPDGFLFFCISDRVAYNILKSKIKGNYFIKVAKKPNTNCIIDLICKENIFFSSNFSEKI